MRNKVYYYSPMPSDSTAFYRTSGVLPFVDSNEFELVDVSSVTAFNWANLVACKVFIFQRPFTKEHVQLLTLLKDMDIRVIADFDDNLLTVDMHNPTYWLYQSNIQNIHECLKLADEVWVSTQVIAHEYKHKNTHIVPNAHNDYLFPVSDKKQFNTDSKKVIYRGGASHQADVNEVADKLIETVNDNMDWTFQFMGDRFTYLEQRCGDNYHIVPGMTIMQYFKYFYNENPNAVIFPLCTTTFNKGKSNISWIEASYAGAAFFGNTDLPEFNQVGTLPLTTIKDLLKQTTILEKANNNSWEYVRDNLLLSKINEKRTERIIANL